jgi:folate-binding protein YgfZ
MTQNSVYHFQDRALVRLEGPSARSFLQGLVSNDVTKVTFSAPVYSTLLTPQGKFLFDFFIVQPDPENPDLLWLDTRLNGATDLVKRLSLFRLRNQLDISLITSGETFLGLDSVSTCSFEAAVTYIDPRHPEMGKRVILKSDESFINEIKIAPLADFHRNRIRLCVPESPLDLQPEKTTLLEANLDELNGIDWNKGCYMGQEVTARTRYRGLVKKRFMPVHCPDGQLVTGDAILQGVKKIGQILGAQGNRAIATVRVDAAREHLKDGSNLSCQESGNILSIELPEWLKPIIENNDDE